ncbi:MAG: ROK family protein [Blautia sp.]|nr:ROK family protein [Blautia sp.]
MGCENQLINMTLGGTLIIGSKIHRGENQISGTVEHMSLHPGGRKCYCGQKGCVEAYCSLNALIEQAGAKTPSVFFEDLRAGSSEASSVWDTYLTDLAMTINNATHVVDCDVVLSGHLSTYLCEDDLVMLEQKLNNLSSFPFRKQRIKIVERRKDIAAVGAAIWQINNFFRTL